MKNEALWLAELLSPNTSRYRRERMLKFGGAHMSRKLRRKRARHFQRMEVRKRDRLHTLKLKWARGQG